MRARAGIGFRARAAVTVFAMGVVAVGCSGSDEGSDTPASVPPSVSIEEEEDPFSEGTEQADVEVDVDDFDLEIDEDVIIATEDGEIPPTSTEPPIEDTPDAPPPVPEPDAPTTTVEPVAPPAAEDIGRIVSLSPTHTETLFALGLGEFVVGVDSESDFPEEAVALQQGGLSADQQNIDVILELEPDIVLVGDDPTDIASRLASGGVATYVGPQADSLDEVFTQIGDIAALVGRPDLAEDLVASLRSDIDTIVAELPAGAADAGLTVFHEIDPTLFTVGSDSFLSDVYGTLGLTNIAGPGEIGQITQMTNDEVTGADPDVIVLADFECCDVTIDRIAARPGWGELSAVSNGAVIPVPDELVNRWGPRVVELLRLVAGGVAAAA